MPSPEFAQETNLSTVSSTDENRPARKQVLRSMTFAQHASHAPLCRFVFRPTLRVLAATATMAGYN